MRSGIGGKWGSIMNAVNWALAALAVLLLTIGLSAEIYRRTQLRGIKYWGSRADWNARRVQILALCGVLICLGAGILLRKYG